MPRAQLRLLTAKTSMSASDNLKLLRQKTETRLREIAARTHGVFGLCALDLVNGEQFVVNENALFPQASAIKIPILMEIFKQAHDGKFQLSDLRQIESKDKTSGSGILADLGDGTVRLSLHDLCLLMIVLSDNTATNILIDLAGMEQVNRTLQSLGHPQTRLQRRMMDTAASLRGDENLSTPAEAARIMELLYRGEFINRSVCENILAILKKTKPSAFTSVLPAGTTVAFKPGHIPGVATEWALVLLKDRPYVAAIMENYGPEKDPGGVAREISQTLYGYFSRLACATPHGAYLTKAFPGPT
jgi:beta-lactamase class A